GEAKPCSAMDFGKALTLPGARRPLDLEGVAAELSRIEVARARERVHDFAACLGHRAEREKRTSRRKAGLLRELALRRSQQIGVGSAVGQSFGAGPRSGVLLRPEPAARMGEQNLGALATASINQQPSADLGSAGGARHQRMSRKSGNRFSEKDMRKSKIPERIPIRAIGTRPKSRRPARSRRCQSPP